MSSILVTSHLHNSWKQQAKNIAAVQNQNVGPSLLTCPQPSLCVPPPEEFAQILSALLPYQNHGITPAIFSAILAATSAPYDVNDEAFLPVHYMAGGSVHDNRLLTWTRTMMGTPVVCFEPFPLSHLYGDGNAPSMATSVPPVFLNKVGFVVPSGALIFPVRRNSIQEVPEDETDFLHGRETTRPAGSPVFYMHPVRSSLLYTGCTRMATNEEVDQVFDELIRPNDWIRMQWNVRDWFELMDLPSDIIGNALRATEAGAVTAIPSSPVAESPTNVPAPTRRATAARRSRNAFEELAGAPVDPPAIGNLTADVAAVFTSRRGNRVNAAAAQAYNAFYANPPAQPATTSRPAMTDGGSSVPPTDSPPPETPRPNPPINAW
jgi:hypothetical protein